MTCIRPEGVQRNDPSCPHGRVMDGMHRIARALLGGVAEIGAVRFPHPLEPDYRDVQPDQLPY